MKKTIVISTDNSGRQMCLDQIMRDATGRGYVVNKNTIVFDSKQEAKDVFSSLSRILSRGVKFITLNEKQARLINELKTTKQNYYINLNRFLEIE